MDKLFVPSQSNNFYPHLTRRAALFAYTLLLFIFNILFTSFSPYFKSEVAASNITPGALISLTNQARAANGLSSLNSDSRLASAAYAKAQDMFAKQYWAHFGPNGETPWQFISGAGYVYLYAGENLAKGFATNEGVHNAWMASPTHRDNILKAHYTDIGIAVVDGVLLGEQTTLVVQMFGTPQGAPPPVEQPKPAPPPPVTQPQPVITTPTAPAQPAVEIGEIKSIAITSPAEGARINSREFAVTGKVEVEQQVVGAYTVKINDGQTELSEISSESTEWIFNKNNWEDGEHKISAVLQYEQQEFADDVTVQVDATAPVISNALTIVYSPEEKLWNVTVKISQIGEGSALIRSGAVTVPLNLLEGEDSETYTAQIADSDLDTLVEIEAADDFENRSKLDITDKFVKPAVASAKDPEKDSALAGLLARMNSPESIRSAVNIGFVLFLFILLSVQAYHYYRQRKLSERSGYLFSLMLCALVILVSVVGQANLGGIVG